MAAGIAWLLAAGIAWLLAAGIAWLLAAGDRLAAGSWLLAAWQSHKTNCPPIRNRSAIVKPAC